jgi:hypothetical protein
MSSPVPHDPVRKCAQCTFPIQPSEDRVVYDRGEWLHVSCWRILSRRHIHRTLAHIAAVLCVRCRGGIRGPAELTVMPEGPAHTVCSQLA